MNEKLAGSFKQRRRKTHTHTHISSVYLRWVLASNVSEMYNVEQFWNEFSLVCKFNWNVHISESVAHTSTHVFGIQFSQNVHIIDSKTFAIHRILWVADCGKCRTVDSPCQSNQHKWKWKHACKAGLPMKQKIRIYAIRWLQKAQRRQVCIAEKSEECKKKLKESGNFKNDKHTTLAQIQYDCESLPVCLCDSKCGEEICRIWWSIFLL